MRRSSLYFFGYALITACNPGDETSGSDSDTSTVTTSTESDTESASEVTTAGTSTTAEPGTSSTSELTGTDSDEETFVPETETDATETDASTTEDDEPLCPNNMLDEGEECDDGMLNENGPCVEGCLNNVCGDGFVYTGVEDCDMGEQNGAYAGSCGWDCTVDSITYCGDGLVQNGDEACEGNDLNPDGVPCDAETCQWGEFHYVFLTSHSFTGDLASELVDADLTGVYRADLLCQALAVGAGLPGSYYAWLSDNNNLAGSNAADRIGDLDSDAAYVMPNGGGLVAYNWNELTSDGPLAPILSTEKGEELDPPPTAIWTNTSIAGISLGEPSCENWSSNDSIGWAGFPVIGSEWTDKTSLHCDDVAIHLYCFEGVEK